MGPAGVRRPAAPPDPILTAPAERRVELGARYELIESDHTPSSARSDRIRRVQAMKILVVEDEPKVAQALLEGLAGEGYDVTIEGSGEGAFFRATTESFDTILLDVMLPGRDGVTILQTLRARGMKTPVLVLTARDTLEDRVRGLDSGADDYLVKPFAFAELLARIRALVRRGRANDALRITVGDLDVDLVTRSATRAGRSLDLTAREFELLHYLMSHERQVVSRDSLARDVWKEPSRTGPLDNVIDVHIARLRRKLETDQGLKLIHTVRGVGFMLREGEP
jgi:two-component system, OmpR family, copper resistance phosphate regulon response regulator CusR